MNQQRLGGQGANRPVAGEILAQDDKSITVKTLDGGSKIILLTSTTTISKATEGTKEDLKAGEQVRISGTINPDGSVSALNIQLGNLGVAK